MDALNRLPTGAGTAGPSAARTHGELRLHYRRRGARTVMTGAYRAGAARVVEPAGQGPVAEGVLINTAGGVTGGDRFSTVAELDEGAAALLTTQACEKIYRAAPGARDAEISTRIRLAPEACLDWLPQPTILFDGARLTRRIEIDMAASASCLALEAVILGRKAMGETVRTLTFLDGWRIRRDGRLAFADATCIRGDAAAAGEGPATLRGNRAFALVVHVAPGAAERLEVVRQAIDDAPAQGGASAWNGLLSVRLLASDGQALVGALGAVIPVLTGRALPRMWSI